MKKKLFAIILCGAFACSLALVGCAGGGGESESAPEPEAEASQTGMPNPWTDVATPEEAAAGAGIDSFNVPTEGKIQDMEIVGAPVFRCMDGIAEADYEFGAASLCVRKGLATAAAEPDDISGVYEDYAKSWTIDVNGVPVTCKGNVDGQAILTLWTDAEYAYSLFAQGLGGDENFGLKDATVTELATMLMSAPAAR